MTLFYASVISVDLIQLENNLNILLFDLGTASYACSVIESTYYSPHVYLNDSICLIKF